MVEEVNYEGAREWRRERIMRGEENVEGFNYQGEDLLAK